MNEIKEGSISKTVDFADLSSSNGFLYRDELCIKTDGEQNAVGLSDGAEYDEMCGEQVEPVDITINFTRRT